MTVRVMDSRSPSRDSGGDLLVALVLAALLSTVWAWRDWGNLAALHLPDTDDVMRLQQIRDWLGGQAFGDLAQHRLGAAPGLTMHWSRLADLVPGGIIHALAPQIGQHDAELAAVIIWPGLLFAAALALVGAITRRIDPHAAPATAMIIAALAYPATTVFVPGRIDHHGLQVVLLLILVRAMLARPSLASGVVAALATAASLIVGLETAPLLAVAAALLWIGWCREVAGSNAQMLGYGMALGLAVGFGAIVFGGSGWGYPACDGFTARTWMIAQLGAFAPICLALIGRRHTGLPIRLASSLALGVALIAIIGPGVRACLNPYGGVDPLLARLWLGHVGEAQPLLGADPATAIGYAGVMLAGLMASIWCWLRTARRRWMALIALQVAAVALTCWQLRGAYAGAMLAAPALAMLVSAARERGAGWLALGWAASAGILYPIAAQAVARLPGAAPQPAPSAAACLAPTTLAHLAALPPGVLIAPIDAGAYAVAATPHRLIAAPYHRNNAGNAAMYRFFLGTPAAARRIAAAWHADYALICPDQMAEIDPATRRDPHRLIGQIAAGTHPAWLTPIDKAAHGPIYRISETR